MKKLGWLLSCLFVLGLCAPLAYAKCEVDPLPSEYVCPTPKVETMLNEQNLDHMPYWKNPACLELIIAKLGTFSVIDQDNILKGLANAWKSFKTTPPAKKQKSDDGDRDYDFWVDRENYIRLKLGDVSHLADERNRQGNPAPSCSMPKGLWTKPVEEFVMKSGKEIVTAYLCIDGNSVHCKGKYSVLKDEDKNRFVQYMAITPGCLQRLIDGYDDSAFGSGLANGYVGIINEIKDVDVGKAQCGVHRTCFTGKSYTRCTIDELHAKLYGQQKNDMPRGNSGGNSGPQIESDSGSGNGNGLGNGGYGDGPLAGKPYWISNFKIIFDENQE